MKNNKYQYVKKNRIPYSSSILVNSIIIIIPKSIKKIELKNSIYPLILNSILIFIWSIKTKKENIKGEHSKENLKLLKYRFLIFIISEIILFSSLFWIYLNNSLSPDNTIRTQWPPIKITISKPIIFPIYGSLILIYSGILITSSHNILIKNSITKSTKKIKKCILIGIIFIDIQISEYSFSNIINFTINDSNYGNRFFLITGTHGSHVIIGIIILITSIKIIKKISISNKNNSRFEISAWYWHFVDIVWLFVFTLIYWINF